LKVLLAIDGSACSRAAVDEVAGRSWPAGSEARIINVVEHHGPLVSGGALTHHQELEGEERERARAILDGAAERIQAAGVANGNLTITTDIRQGTAKRVIVEEAEAWGADLIVVGSHGYRSWERMLLGSVSQAVAMHAECSVQIVRRPMHRED
jgi:nucleotide-binding universal stress UspA family protein